MEKSADVDNAFTIGDAAACARRSESDKYQVHPNANRASIATVAGRPIAASEAR
jgi:hypothetical protein